VTRSWRPQELAGRSHSSEPVSMRNLSDLNGSKTCKRRLGCLPNSASASSSWASLRGRNVCKDRTDIHQVHELSPSHDERPRHRTALSCTTPHERSRFREVLVAGNYILRWPGAFQNCSSVSEPQLATCKLPASGSRRDNATQHETPCKPAWQPTDNERRPASQSGRSRRSQRFHQL